MVVELELASGWDFLGIRFFYLGISNSEFRNYFNLGIVIPVFGIFNIGIVIPRTWDFIVGIVSGFPRFKRNLPDFYPGIYWKSPGSEIVFVEWDIPTRSHLWW